MTKHSPESLAAEAVAVAEETGLTPRQLAEQRKALLEACQTFAEWLRRDDEGFDLLAYPRDTPEGEKAWKAWWYGNLDLCSLAQRQARAAIAAATGSAS